MSCKGIEVVRNTNEVTSFLNSFQDLQDVEFEISNIIDVASYFKKYLKRRNRNLYESYCHFLFEISFLSPTPQQFAPHPFFKVGRVPSLAAIYQDEIISFEH